MAEDHPNPRETARRWFEEAWNQRQAATVRELWAEDGVGHIEGMPDITLDDFLQYHEHMLGAFSDFHVEILDTLVSDERVVTHWRITGTHDGPLFGVPPTGRKMEEYGMTMFHIRDGIIVEGWDNWNLGALLDRLSRPSIQEIVRVHPLTERQAQVALLMADLRTSKQIAKELGISTNTARRHCQDVLTRLGLHSRAEVADALGRVRIAVSGPHML